MGSMQERADRLAQLLASGVLSPDAFDRAMESLSRSASAPVQRTAAPSSVTVAATNSAGCSIIVGAPAVPVPPVLASAAVHRVDGEAVAREKTPAANECGGDGHGDEDDDVVLEDGVVVLEGDDVVEEDDVVAESETVRIVESGLAPPEEKNKKRKPKDKAMTLFSFGVDKKKFIKDKDGNRHEVPVHKPLVAEPEVKVIRCPHEQCKDSLKTFATAQGLAGTW